MKRYTSSRCVFCMWSTTNTSAGTFFGSSYESELRLHGAENIGQRVRRIGQTCGLRGSGRTARFNAACMPPSARISPSGTDAGFTDATSKAGVECAACACGVLD